MLKLDDLIKDLSQTQNLSFSKGVINAKLPIFFFFFNLFSQEFSETQ